VPTGRALPLSRLCMDSALEPPAFAANSAAARTDKNAAQSVDTCESEDWIQTQGGGPATAASPSSTAGSSGAAGGTVITAGADNSLWVVLGNQNKVVRITHDADGTLSSSQAIALPSAPKSPKPGPYVAYQFHYVTADSCRCHITTRTFQLFMRSTYGVYNYVGGLLRYDTDIVNLLPNDKSGSGRVIRVLKTPSLNQAADLGCFAEVNYRRVRYCVPNSSDETKRIFALLHELQQLNTAPSNSPTTLTTVSTPAS